MRHQQAKKVTLISALCNFLLAICKMIVGSISGSHALFADGLHSLSDLLTDFLIIIASKYGNQEADDDHPYGHRRIETAATFFLSLLLVVTGCAILYDSALQFLVDQRIHDSSTVLSIVVLSLVVNEGLFHYTLYYGNKLHSKLLVANAWHHRSDSLSSLVVLIGVIGNLMGFYYCDGVAAFIVGLLIIQMGWSIGWNSMQELIDKAIDPSLLKQINEAIHETPGVVAVHQLRTRSMAGAVLVDVHVLVDSDLTVSEGHFISQHVAVNIREAVKSVSDVTVHIDPEDDEIVNPSIDLPPREELVKIFLEHLQGLLSPKSITRIDLHYLDGAIVVDLFIEKGLKVDVRRCSAAILSCTEVRDVNIYQSI